MKSAISIVLVIVGIYVIGMYLAFGAIEPCSALKNNIRAELFSASTTFESDNEWETAGTMLGTALAGPFVDNMVDSLSPVQCIRGLYKMTVEGEKPFDMGTTDGLDQYAFDDKKSDIEKDIKKVIEEKLYPTTWDIRTEKSKLDDSESIYLSVYSEESITDWLGSEVRPGIFLRCVENKTEAFISLGTRPETKYDNNYNSYVATKLRYDENKPIAKNFWLSTNGKAIFFKRYIPSVKEMMQHDKLILRFTAANSGDKTVTFDISGLEETIIPLREACHW